MPITPQYDLSLQHIQLELARLDVLIRQEVRRWQLAGQNPHDAFRGFYTANEEIGGMASRPFGTSWGQMVTLSAEESTALRHSYAQAQHELQQFMKQAEQPLRLQQLQSAFNLSQFELDTLLICLAPTLDLRYEQLYGFLQDHVNRRRPTINLVLNLLVEAGPQRLAWLPYFGEGATLIQQQLLKCVPEPNAPDSAMLNQMLLIDPTVVAWLWGSYQPNFSKDGACFFSHQVTSSHQMTPIDDLLVAETAKTNLPNIKTQRPLIAFYGLDRGSQEATAQFIAQQLNQPLLMVDLTEVVSGSLTPLQAVRLVLRDARLTGAVPCLFGWDSCLTDKKPNPRLLRELCEYPDTLMVAGEVVWQAGNLERERALFRLEFPLPSYQQRLALWQHFLQLVKLNDLVKQAGLAQLAGHFRLTTYQIRDAVASAKDKWVQHGQPLTIAHLFETARTHSHVRLSDLAYKITPRYGWDDLILPPEQVAVLREIVNMVDQQPTVLEEWAMGRKLTAGLGIAILFSGPPGTGKTMAAEVMAGQLGLDLYKIDLSTVVSKYIGETEKNLERIFTEAERSNAILFFDEADALFGKRSEVSDSHDRYANIEISYLLQRMEVYNGITILATNLRANLDEAFGRRLQFALDFPFPDEVDRLRIWETLFPPTVPRAANVNFKLLADRFKLAGGNIRNIIMGAAYLAAGDGKVVTMNHLLHATAREMQKMGRLVKEL